MDKQDIKILDCTLRDGGYVNDWNWGFYAAQSIIKSLVRSKIDIVEVGFLRNVESYQRDITVCNHIEELNKLLPENTSGTIFSAMAMRSNYDVDKLSQYSGKGVELIRVTAHDYDIKEGLEFAQKIQGKGYKVSINPINIMGYQDYEILEIVQEVNKINPYQFSIVDTFGSMKKKDLSRIISLVDHNLNQNIRLALHLHENMSLSCCLAQLFIDMHLKRPISVDGSLMGMGRTPGNLPIELIADYLNDINEKSYDLDFLMDAIQDYIIPLKGESNWGYTPAYFLSAKYNLHRNYAEYYLDKGDLTNRDINQILSLFDKSKSTVFDTQYADNMYQQFKMNAVNDEETKRELRTLFEDQNILIMAPGSTLISECEKINNFILSKRPLIVSINFLPDLFETTFCFFSNGKRYGMTEVEATKVIVTSNIHNTCAKYIVDFNKLINGVGQLSNSFLLLLRLLSELGIQSVYVAGADGYRKGEKNYYHSDLRSKLNQSENYNEKVAQIIKNLGIEVKFITPSEYTEFL